MLLALLVWLLAITVAVLFGIQRWWFPPGINNHARQFDHHFLLTLAVTGSVFFLAQLALGWLIIRNRNRQPSTTQPAHNNLAEIGWTTAAAILFIGVAGISSQIWARVHLDQPSPQALRVETLAKQFAWNFRYPGPDGKFGRTDIKFINDANGNPFGIDEKDPAGKDDIVTAGLRVPAGSPIVLQLKARDVIHNFFVRELRLKQDLVPGLDTSLAFTADKPGTYEVACSELCGLGHHQMRTTLTVMPPDEFREWLRQAGPAGGSQ
jgi:cytochrome c oxidase subunit 2